MASLIKSPEERLLSPDEQHAVSSFKASDMAAAERRLGMAQGSENKWAAFQQLFAGVSAGITTTICTHPLDLIKTRMQSMSTVKGAI